MNLKSIHLLIACLNLLEERVKYRITECLDRRWLDRALNEMIQDGKFPEWFAEEFHYDPLYGLLDGLRGHLSTASANGLLRMDGTNFNYHPDLSESVINHLICEIGMDKKDVRALAQQLNGLLLSSFS